MKTATAPAFESVVRRAPSFIPSVPAPGDEPLDESGPMLGIGRSLGFPFPQWRMNDPYRTVCFDAGRGQPVVFVHGMGANATHWEHVAMSLVGTHRVVGLDLVGFGWTGKPDVPYNLELLRDHLLDFLDRRGINNPVLVGHSMGGAVCMAALLKRPALARGLVLVCSAGVGQLPSWMRMGSKVFVHRALLFQFLSRAARFILRSVFVDTPEENERVAEFYRSALRDDPGYPNLKDFARVSESLCKDLALRDFSWAFPTMHMPVLGIWGDADKLTPLQTVLDNLGSFRRVRTVILKRCGHMPMVERAEETAFHIQRFLANPPREIV